VLVRERVVGVVVHGGCRVGLSGGDLLRETGGVGMGVGWEWGRQVIEVPMSHKVAIVEAKTRHARPSASHTHVPSGKAYRGRVHGGVGMNGCGCRCGVRRRRGVGRGGVGGASGRVVLPLGLGQGRVEWVVLH
jgi:hypothetical protein